MTYWSKELINQVENMLVGCRVLFVDIRDCTNRTGNYEDEIMKSDLVLGYSRRHRLYVAWNAYLHRGRKTLSVDFRNIKNIKTYLPRRSVLNDNCSGYEKQVIISPDYLLQFCNNWLEYMLPKEEDKGGFDIKLMWADSEHPKPFPISEYNENIMQSERSVHIHNYYERDLSFRKKVLDNYEHKCAICRCSIDEILEAHHIIAVSNNGSDNLTNGICLCSNHHKMVHTKLITLNMTDNTYEVNDRVIKEIFIKWSIDNFHKQLIKPKSKR